MDLLLEPFSYSYMTNAMWVSALVGGVCAFLSAYLICDRFPRLIALSVAIGALTSFLGAYASYFLDGATGGIIVTLQTMIFLVTFLVAPKHGLLAARRKAAEALRKGPADQTAAQGEAR